MASPPILAAGLLYVRHDGRADRAVITAVPEAHMGSPRGGGPRGKRNGMFKHHIYTREAVEERRLLRQSRGALVLLSQIVTANREKNQIFGEIPFSTWRLTWLTKVQIVKRGLSVMSRCWRMW